MSKDMINHPPHYLGAGLECIVAIAASMTPEEFRAYCRGNAFKYIWRARHKGDEAENYQKAIWYLERAAESTMRGVADDEPELPLEDPRKLVGSEWRVWGGGERPESRQTIVEVTFRNGDVRTCRAGALVWRHFNYTSDIVRYRIVG